MHKIRFQPTLFAKRPAADNPAQIARARAKLTVASDRLLLHPEEYAQMCAQLRQVLEKYIALDTINGRELKITLNLSQGTDRGVADVKTIQVK